MLGSIDKDTKFTGASADIWNELANYLDFTYL